MSRLTDLIREAKKLDAKLGDALEDEVRHLQQRRAFGLNFERHTPEAVDLYGRPVRLGDKVRMLPPRGQATPVDKRLWIVTGGESVDGLKHAHLRDPKTDDVATYPVDDLVVVAEHTDVIYPGLVSTGKVERGGSSPFHTVINGENLHVLKALLYTHAGRIDCIYIDPPYNTGAKDWKYNNDYVEKDDLYRHSKWLAFMERRLKVAKTLLSPQDSVLIITIDEKEYLRLGLLLEQVFPSTNIQMVTSVISPSGQPRANQMSRVEEYLFIVYIGQSRVGQDTDDTLSDDDSPPAPTVGVSWENLIRRGTSARRVDRENQFYPFIVDPNSGQVVSVGDPLLPVSRLRTGVTAPTGLEIVWPIRSDGTEGRWRISSTAARGLLERGLLRAGRRNRTSGQRAMNYVLRSDIARIEEGEIRIVGRASNGSAILERVTSTSSVAKTPKTVWNKESHNAGNHGSALLRQILPGRSFPFPKSLYAVEDALRMFIGAKPDAVVLDFFSGSGTTAHAVSRLNRLDGGSRQCISVTNNEVAASEQHSLRAIGLRPGDADWEALGICDHITKPRIEAAITGRTPDGDPIVGSYRFVDEFPMADGIAANAEFFTLTYEAPLAVAANHAFGRIAPLLWLRAGSRGRRIEDLSNGWEVADTYGVIDRLDRLDDFLTALVAQPAAKVAFIVTDDDRRFQAALAQLPDGVEPVRLYESYLRNFEIDAVRSSR